MEKMLEISDAKRRIEERHGLRQVQVIASKERRSTMPTRTTIKIG